MSWYLWLQRQLLFSWCLTCEPWVSVRGIKPKNKGTLQRIRSRCNRDFGLAMGKGSTMESKCLSGSRAQLLLEELATLEQVFWCFLGDNRIFRNLLVLSSQWNQPTALCTAWGLTSWGPSWCIPSSLENRICVPYDIIGENSPLKLANRLLFGC